VGERRVVLFVSNHPDTAELYAYALEDAGFSVQCAADIEAALAVIGSDVPSVIIVHLLPRQNPTTIGAQLRKGRSSAVLIGLMSVQLPLASLKPMLDVFDDVVLIPCTPEALVGHVIKLEQEKPRRSPA
jgi:DNA-binding response OmpR family regulator